MRFNKKLLMQYVLLLLYIPGFAQDAGEQAAKEVTSSTNMLAVSMIAVALILAFVIYALGQVLIILTRQVLEKNKTPLLILVLLAGLSLVSNVSYGQEVVSGEVAVKVVPNYGGLSSTAFWTLATVIIIEVIAVLFMLSFIGRMKAELLPAKTRKPLPLMEWWKRLDKKVLTAAIPIEKEKDIQLDHDYDGIKELDNSLPPWWKWGFIITIFTAVFYLFNFHVFGSGKNPTEEYEAELAQAKTAMEIYAAKNKDKIDEENIQLADASGMAAGREIFEQTCWACHGKAGEGGAGPNLTDDYWLHKGSLNDIYQSIKMGYPDKGMQSWQKQYSPRQISNLTSYIKSLHGTNPANAKAPQGDLFSEAAIPDSTAVASLPADSSKK